MKILITGHHSLGNRGCEAILRSTVASVRTRFPQARFFVPSSNPEADGQQWPEAANCAVSFIEAARSNRFLRAWARTCRVAPFMARATWPIAEPPASWKTLLPKLDLLMVIGGDNYTLDYGLESLGLHVGLSSWAIRHSLPVVLWGASVGPFELMNPYGSAIRESMARHLRQFQAISVRESISAAYVRTMLDGPGSNRDGGHFLSEVTDPAFNLIPQPVDLEPHWPRGDAPVLGLNISPHVVAEAGRQKHRDPSDQSLDLDALARFIRQRCESGEFRVVCVPHVSARIGSGVPQHSIASKWDDDVLLDSLMTRLQGVRGVGRIPAWDAPKLKHAIAQCDLFIGARTHSVIAALSSGVPTLALAYSTKAHGIHRDLFGHEHGVLAHPQLTPQALQSAMDQLARRALDERAFLLRALPSWRTKALQAVAVLPEPKPRCESAKPSAA